MDYGSNTPKNSDFTDEVAVCYLRRTGTPDEIKIVIESNRAGDLIERNGVRFLLVYPLGYLDFAVVPKSRVGAPSSN